MVLTDELCEAIIDEVYESEEYQNASVFLESEIAQLLGDNEEEWAKHNDAYVALENAIVRTLFQVVYSSGVNDGKQIAVAAKI